MSETRLPPHSIEAELNVLSAIMIDPECIYDIPGLKPVHFYSKKHGRIFQGLQEMMERGIRPDVVTVPDYIVDMPLDELVGLIGLAAPSYQVQSYARIVSNNHTRRELLDAASEIAKMAYRDDMEIDDLVDKSTSALFDRVVLESEDDLTSVHDIVDELIDDFQRRAAAGGETDGLLIGFDKLDNLLRGIKPGDLYIIAARPGMGKTSLGTNVAENIARQGRSVAFFSLEMSKRQVTYRLVAQMAEVSYNDIAEGRRAQPGGDRYKRVMKAFGELSELPIFIDEEISTAKQMYAKIRRFVATHEVDIVIVDYLQLMASDKDHGNRTQDVSAMSQGLKALAKQLRIPVVALSQLSRKVEDREDKHPRLSDLRDSGKIEEDASVVLFIYREDYYYDDPDDVEEPGVAHIDVAKNRYGETGRAKLGWEGEYGRFTNDTMDMMK